MWEFHYRGRGHGVGYYYYFPYRVVSPVGMADNIDDLLGPNILQEKTKVT